MSTAIVAASAVSAARAPVRSPLVFGIAAGLAVVVIWGGYLALARVGISGGLGAMDFAVLRYGVAGLVMLPWLLGHDPVRLAGVGWRKGALLALFAGPPFILLAVGGYAFAPLAHGAVLQPATVVVLTTVIAALVLGERPGRARVAGIAVILAGLAVIAGPGLAAGGTLTFVGDLMFVGAGALWAGFVVLTRRWQVGAIPGTAAVSVISALAIVPLYALTGGFATLAALPLPVLLLQMLVQGVLSGVVAVILFTRAVALLGASSAAIFPALVPAATILIGIPVAGEWPTAGQWLGLAVVSGGLLIAVGAVGFAAGRLTSSTDSRS